jgi:hypothetical protein
MCHVVRVDDSSAAYDGAVIRPLPDPWRVLSTEERGELELELAAETAPGHPLHGHHSVAIARCTACDDVVFSVETDPIWFAVVHLTWRQSQQPPPWPRTTVVTLPLADSLAMHSH